MEAGRELPLADAFQKVAELNTQIFYKNYAIHKKPFPPSIIFYIIKESQKEIHILRILRNECDWKTSRKSAIINQIKPKGAIYHGKDH